MGTVTWDINQPILQIDSVGPCTQLVVNPSTVAQPELHRHRPRKKWKWHAVKPFLVWLRQQNRKKYGVNDKAFIIESFVK